MRLEMGRVDHEPLGLAGFACPLRESLVEHAKTAPAHEPIIDRLVRPVVAERIAPAQAILDDEDNPRNDPPVINSGVPVRQRGRMSQYDAAAPRRAETNHPWRRPLAPPVNQSKT